MKKTIYFRKTISKFSGERVIIEVPKEYRDIFKPGKKVRVYLENGI